MPLISLNLAWTLYPKSKGVYIKVLLVDYPAILKLSKVPLFKLLSESRLIPRFSFYLLDKIVLGVAYNKAPPY